MHGTQGMGETRMLGSRIYETGTLKLIDAAQPLEPGGIDEVLFRFFLAVSGGRHGEQDITVDRVGDQGYSFIEMSVRGLCFHGFYLPQKKKIAKGEMRKKYSSFLKK